MTRFTAPQAVFHAILRNSRKQKARHMAGLFIGCEKAQTFFTNSDFSFIAPMPSILQSMS